MIDAVVLAGGFGTRLRSVVPDLPKPMAPVAGRPFLEILLGSLARRGVRRAVLSLGYQADVIQRHFGTRFSTAAGDVDLAYCVETTPLGTGGAIRFALDTCTGPLALVVNGDTYLDLDLNALLAAHGAGTDPVIVGRALDDAARFGRLRCEGDRVVGFSEKGADGGKGGDPGGPGVINSGHYLLPTALFSGSPLPAAFSFETDYLPVAVQQRRFALYLTQGAFIDIGVPDDYQRAQTSLAHLM